MVTSVVFDITVQIDHVLKVRHTCQIHTDISDVVQKIIFVIIHNFPCQFLFADSEMRSAISL